MCQSIFTVTLILAATSPLFAAAAPVKAWEEKVTIPTYLIGPPDPNPQFYFGGNSQGATPHLPVSCLRQPDHGEERQDLYHGLPRK
jgi:hypothetical protein